ncbi:TPR repeat-containing protein NMB0313 precursor [Kingella potus]|uniref:TPR repeat-containing protein NMB0313 n=1 Tax=Kingella potus TaxID=265175 RepID=A0A377R0J2_9NEIS|nr:porin family protein [Kingella potus]STR00609.1 TPR repeat-containing protein NMB0313 precursor [Kingella potus]
MQRYFLYCLSACAALAAASPDTAGESGTDTDLTRIQRQQAVREPAQPVPPHDTGNAPVSMTEDELLAQPELLQNALDIAVSRQDTDNIRFLLALYRRLPESSQDAVLADYAQAVLSAADGRYAESERLLHGILARNPEYSPVRLQLALVLSQSGQNREAQEELDRLRQTPDLPADTAAYIGSFAQYLENSRKWQLDGSAYYIADKNVGRTPKEREYGNWRFPEPKSAHGVGYEASAQKTLPLKKHWSARVQASLYGKYYWDAHDYNDLNLRFETGPVRHGAKTEISLMPFAEKRWYAAEPYSHTAGGSLRGSYMVSPKTVLFGAWQSGYKTHKERDHLDGATHGGAFSLMYQTSPQQYFVFGAGGGRENARDRSEAYRHGSIRAGWTRRWQGGEGLVTAINGSVQRRFYRESDLFNIRRHDTEYFLRTSVGHKKLSWKGFAPRLNWTWGYTGSNHFYYRRHENRVFLDVSKQF